MIYLLSPAKSLDYTPSESPLESTLPQFLEHTQKLHKILKKLKTQDIMDLMSVSEKIAQLNVQRFQDFTLPLSSPTSKEAILAFDGDVYDGLCAKNLNQEQLEWAQENLRILSGFYGILRPLDLIFPYRLEMGTTLTNPKGKDLYQFWGDSLAKHLKAELEKHNQKEIINLASIEYSKVITGSKVKLPIITLHFKEFRNQKLQVISFFAKKARGQMMDIAIRNKIQNPEQLKKFNVDGYEFNEEFSSDKDWVFTRS